MSPRPQLGIGEYGAINTTGSGKEWVARARYRDIDGSVRQVSAQATSKTGAAAALREKLRARARTGAELTNESRIEDLAQKYLAMKESEDLAYNTIRRLQGVVEDHIIPKIGQLRIREATPERLDRLIVALVKDHGPATALVIRSCLSGMFRAAVRWGMAEHNPVAYTTVPKLARQEIRAMTLQEFVAMRAHAVERLRPLTVEERAARANGDSKRMGGANRDPLLVDVVDFLIATGSRAAEVLGTAWADVHLDVTQPYVVIRQQVIRKAGQGLVLTPTKERDVRRLRLPQFAVEMLRRRLTASDGFMVFTSRLGTLVDPRTMRRAWQQVFTGSPWEWVTQKTLRKTVATLVDAEYGSEVAAKQLGHTSDAMTKRFYIAPSMVPIDTGGIWDEPGTD